MSCSVWRLLRFVLRVCCPVSGLWVGCVCLVFGVGLFRLSWFVVRCCFVYDVLCCLLCGDDVLRVGWCCVFVLLFVCCVWFGMVRFVVCVCTVLFRVSYSVLLCFVSFGVFCFDLLCCCVHA